MRVHRDTVAAHERPAATPTASGTTKPASSPGRRNLASIALARLLTALRGDKYMVDAYPAAWHGAFHARRATLRLQRSWPWARELATAFARLLAPPPPAC